MVPPSSRIVRKFAVAATVIAVGSPATAVNARACQALDERQRVAQLVMTGIPGTSFGAAAAELVTRHAGSVILMGSNVEGRGQVRRLTRALHARAEPVRLLVATDEEGGRVSRLGEEGLVPHMPSALGMADTMSPSRVRRVVERVGRGMRRLGVDWDLAPVLDVTSARSSGVIGDRSFGSSPRVVGAYGEAFARGLDAAGVISTGKHFPGHGRTAVDSHQTLPTVRASLGSLRRHDLVPYERADVEVVMTGHVRFTALDRRRPASLSAAATELLREDLEFEGVLMTDDLIMGAITDRWGVPEAAELAIAAGADIALVTVWQLAEGVTNRLLQAAESGRLTPERIDEAAGRVLALKGYSNQEIACFLPAAAGGPEPPR
jgi:beta-N-acetylhexosaminidase